MHRKHFLAAQVWYAVSQGAPAFLNPFLNLFFTQLGIAPAQIGLLSALRPWISAPCGSLIAGLADQWAAHRPLLLFCYLGMTFVQGLMALPVFGSFAAMLALTILSSTVYTPASILADAAVMAASTHPGDYGRLRTWASISWTAFAPLAGWVNSTFGIRVGIACYVVGSLVAVPAAWMLPVEALRRKVAPVIERAPSKEAVGEEAEAAPYPAAAEELRQPLLAREAPSPLPTPPTERRGLSRALAIVRYIEAITELGVAPPPGVGLYGFAAQPLHYAALHLAPAATDQEPEAAASPGYSPFAGAAEPGSQCPGFVLSDGQAGSQAGTGSSAPPATAPTLPAGHAAPAGSAAPEGGVCQPSWPPAEATAPEERTVHGSYDALQELSHPRRPPTGLARPISEGDLGRVASLAQGIPRVRTRPPGQAPGPAAAAARAHYRGQAPVGEEASSPDQDFVVLSPHRHVGWEDEGETGGEEEEEGSSAQGAVFAADDLRAGEHALRARQQLRELQTAPSASALLRDVRGIRGQPPGMPQAAAGPAPAAAQGEGQEEGWEPAGKDSRASTGSAELPVSFIPAEPAVVSGSQLEPAAAAALAAAGGEMPSAASGGQTPVYRSAAIQRLAQIFGGARRGGAGGSGGVPAAAAAPGAGEEEAGDEAGSDLEAGSLAQGSVGLSPVRKYIEHRKDKLERKQQRQRQREQAAAVEGREPEPPTPPPSSAVAFAGLFGMTPTLAAVAQLSHQQQQVSPELMREALDLELADAEHGHDATGSLVVGMLSKKLERLARETKRQRRLQRRAARERARAEAAAAAATAAAAEAGAPAAPRPAEEEGAAAELPGRQRLATIPEEGAVAVPAMGVGAGAEAEAEEPVGFGAALRRLLGDPQVAIFFVLTTILGFGHGIIGGFLFIHLAELGGSELLMGAVLTANALPELPAFFYFGRILSTLGMQTVLFSATATLGLRIWAYSLLPRVGLNWVVPIEALHAITYACGWSASAVNSSKIAPPGLEGTTQGLFQGLWTGVGCGVAGILGGVLYGTHGADFLFELSGLAILACTAAAAVPAVVLRWRRKRRVEPLPSKESMDDLVALAH